MCNNIDESWKHYAPWKKSVTKGHLLYKFIYEMSRKGKFMEMKAGKWLPEVKEYMCVLSPSVVSNSLQPNGL